MRFFMLLLSILILAACAAPPVVVDDTAREEADIQAINRIGELWDAADAAGDVDAFLELVTDDYIRMEPNKPVIVGKEAFRDFLQSFHDKYRLENGRDVIEEIRLADDWAYVRGTWSGTVVPKAGGDPVHVTSKWIDIRERQADGSWKISRGCVNEDAPFTW